VPPPMKSAQSKYTNSPFFMPTANPCPFADIATL
jgi:hypothetical protein